jgi:phosphatidate cytidylyltransferase
MALNLATFRTRSLTAVIFVIIMLAGLLGGKYLFFLLFSFIHFGCWIEYQLLISKIDPDYDSISSFHRYGIMIAGWCLMLNFTSDAFVLFGIRFHALGWFVGLPLLLIFPIVELLFTHNIQLKNIGYSLLGIIYVSLSLGLFTELYAREFHLPASNGSLTASGPFLPMVLIGSLWINDTMAYIVGSMIGKTPFSKISPKKTWEGTIGGAVLAVAVVAIIMYFIQGNQFSWIWPMVAAIAAVTGTAGDLLESKLKRMANVKDSGTIMPGHGGFLDRFDSLLIATPFVWLFLRVVEYSSSN